jgi:hypothetical protein
MCFIVITIVFYIYCNFNEAMCTTFDASGAFKRPPLVKYRWIGHIACEIRITLELSKFVFRFELAQTI